MVDTEQLLQSLLVCHNLCHKTAAACCTWDLVSQAASSMAAICEARNMQQAVGLDKLPALSELHIPDFLRLPPVSQALGHDTSCAAQGSRFRACRGTPSRKASRPLKPAAVRPNLQHSRPLSVAPTSCIICGPGLHEAMLAALVYPADPADLLLMPKACCIRALTSVVSQVGWRNEAHTLLGR